MIAVGLGLEGPRRCSDIIARLAEIGVADVGQRVGLADRARRGETAVGEYAISAVGPGPRATQALGSSPRQRGLKTAAEIQFNNTCELASLPYLPVMDLVAEHCRNLAVDQAQWHDDRLDDGRASFAQLPAGPAYEPHACSRRRCRVGWTWRKNDSALEGGPHARKAWKLMSDAYREYPFHITVVYRSPVQIGPANALYPVEDQLRATMWGIPYDDLDGWRGPYPAEVFAAQFEKVAEGGGRALPSCNMAVDKAPTERRDEVQADLRYREGGGRLFSNPSPTKRGL